MTGLYQQLLRLPQLTSIAQTMESERAPVLAAGLSQIHKAGVVYALTQSKGAVVLTPDEPSAVRLCEDINSLFGAERALHYPARDFTFREVEGVSREYEHARLRVLGSLADGSRDLVVASCEAALAHTMPLPLLRKRLIVLRSGDEWPVQKLTQSLLDAGYRRSEQVEGVGQFAVRGGIIDFFSPHSPQPCRVELWGDEIDSVSTFMTTTQRRDEVLEEAVIFPAREVLPQSADWLEKLVQARPEGQGSRGARAKAQMERDLERLQSGLELASIDRYLPLLYDPPATLLEHTEGKMLICCEPAAVKEAMAHLRYQQGEDVAQLVEEGLLPGGWAGFYEDYTRLLLELERRPSLLLDSFARSHPDIRPALTLELDARQLSVWGGDLGLLGEELRGYLAQNYCVIVLAGSDRGADLLAGDLAQDGLPARRTDDLSEHRPRQVLVAQGGLAAGFEFPQIGLAVITGTRGAARKKTKVRTQSKERGDRIRNIADLTPGDYVVHISHGIGIFEGIIKKEIQGVVKDYIKIRYGGTDMLFVPVTQLDLVTKYIGGREESGIRLSRLNSGEWNKTRQRVKRAVSDMAKELIALYAKRLQIEGFAFSPDGDWQRDFEDRFEYNETEDQLRCIREIKSDMVSPVPMDRLLCGDVGFGKTEVALRAAFKCVLDSKQCAMLVPTTILAWQHYQTFQRRMEGYPVTVELLSRFRTPRQQADVIRRLQTGEVDIVIGTHRLVQKDMAFKDLGLCIIDEEQRFGVAHKERLKELRGSVDVLTLSATPIPRTLNMAMSGIRDMSIIEEAPQDRHPVQTYVLEYDEGLVVEAIKKELRRGGQVFYLHNRVGSIDGCAARLGEALPGAKIGVAHGRMSEEQLSLVWKGLLEREIDILVCTTIIEAGVDVPNCNTLIIEDADRMGLSQLYQLRGRVGRSDRRAFAYFTFHRGRVLTEIAEKRLSAIKEFTAFGSGFRIALRDLEIRGAGDILGSQQHGHMEAVGYDLYLRLLSEAVSEQRGEPVRRAAECTVDLQIGAHIPEDYITHLAQRIDIYKKMAAIATEEDAMDMLDELIDRFGEPPPAVKGLVDVALVRGMAAAQGISEISQRGESVLLYPEQLDMAKAGSLAVALRGRVMVNAGAKPYISVKFKKGQQPVQAIREVLAVLSQKGGKPS